MAVAGCMAGHQQAHLRVIAMLGSMVLIREKCGCLEV